MLQKRVQVLVLHRFTGFIRRRMYGQGGRAFHKIVEGLNQSGILPYEVVWKPTLITNALIRKTFGSEYG